MHFPLPDTDEHLAEISNNRLLITLDLFNGYLQLPIAVTMNSPCPPSTRTFPIPGQLCRYTTRQMSDGSSPTRVRLARLGRERIRYYLRAVDTTLLREWTSTGRERGTPHSSNSERNRQGQEAETVPQLPPEIETQPPQTDAPKPENSTSRIFKARKRAAEALEHQAK
ncbi:hypothetical protein TKK_0018804 [Trichogramma kaykai]